MQPITREQRQAIYKLYNRAISKDNKNPYLGTYRQFRRRAVQGFDCLMLNVWGIWIGIERDGYTHS